MTSPRRTDGWKLVALPAIGIAIAFCNSEGGSGSAPPSGSSGSGIGGTGGTSASIGVFAGNAVATSGTGQGGKLEIPLADAGIPDGDVPPEPMVTCDPAADAGDADICPLPPPTCAGAEWIVYYKNPECVDGLCHFEAFAYLCAPSTYSCIDGGCDYNFTL